MNERRNEYYKLIHEWMNEWGKEGTNERMNITNWYMNEWMRKGMMERINEWTNEYYKLIHEWMNEWMERINEWTNEWILQIDTWMNELMNEWMKQNNGLFHHISHVLSGCTSCMLNTSACLGGAIPNNISQTPSSVHHIWCSWIYSWRFTHKENAPVRCSS